jgi:hypothetical protein
MDNDVNLESLFEEATPEDAETPADDNGTQETAGEPQENAEEAQKPPLTVQERANQAEGRRIREREARAYQAARERDSEIVRGLGLTHPETNKPIETMEDLEAYAQESRSKRLAAGQGTEDDVRQVARQVLREEMRSAPAPAENPEVQRQLAQIRAMDPAMTDLGAILRSEAGEKFRGYVAKGLDFVDAYTLAAKDRLAGLQSNRAAAKAGSKAHLNATKQQGVGALSVPSDQMELFRALNPGASDADIQKYYNADKQKFG